MPVDLQSTNRVKISSVRENAFGVTPNNPVFKTRRVTSHAMAPNPQTVPSNEIRSDRQRKDLILTSLQPGGQVGGEAAFQVLDDDFEEGLEGTWVANPVITVATIDTEISDVSATTLTVSAGGAAFKTGHLTLTSGFTTPANNKLARVANSTGVTIVYPAATFAVEAGQIPVGAAVRVVGFQGAAGDITATANGLASTVLDFTTLGLTVGQSLKVGGAAAGDQFATAANNDFVRLTAIAAHALTFDRLPAGWGVDAGAAKTIIVFTPDMLINGSTLRTRTWERQYLDHAPVTYEYLPGEALDKLTLTIQASQVVTYTAEFIGGGQGSDVTARLAGATDIAAPVNDVLNAASNVGRIGIDGSVVAGPNYVQSVTVEIANNLRRQTAVGSIAPIGIGKGEFAVSLTLNTYFGDKTLLDKLLNNTLTSFDLRIGRSDSNNESYVLDFPSIKYSSGSPSVSSKNADVMLPLGADAIVDATLGYTMSVCRYWYLP